MIDDLAALLWVVNLGCIDLNQWYSRCDDVNRPDYLHFDLDPVDDDVPFGRVLEAAILVRDRLAARPAFSPRRVVRAACTCTSQLSEDHFRKTCGGSRRRSRSGPRLVIRRC